MTSYDIRKEADELLQLEYSAVITKLSGLADEQKHAALAACVAALDGDQTTKNERLRVAAVRAIVALLPLSLGAIAELLTRRQNRHHYEVHFTLFCYLDWSQEMLAASSVAKEALLLVEDYLMTVPRPTARAVWMAEDMLGEHWNEYEAMPVLIHIAQAAKYSVGRQTGLLGLEKMLGRLSAGEADYADVLALIAKVSLSDRSRYVKEDANAVLDHLRRKN